MRNERTATCLQLPNHRTKQAAATATAVGGVIAGMYWHIGICLPRSGGGGKGGYSPGVAGRGRKKMIMRCAGRGQRMQYIGSKRRISKHLLPHMLNDSRPPQQWWVEPFVGGANMIDKIDGLRLGSDINPYLIAMLKAVGRGWDPPTDVSREFYNQVRDNKDKYPPELVGFLGFSCSFSAKWFGSYAKNERKGVYSNRAAASARVLARQRPHLAGVAFQCSNYLELEIPNNSLIYCDPPYRPAPKRFYGVDFDHDQFWDWCREMSKRHTVWISEEYAPVDFECVVEIPTQTPINKGQRVPRVDRLFRLKTR